MEKIKALKEMLKEDCSDEDVLNTLIMVMSPPSCWPEGKKEEMFKSVMRLSKIGMMLKTLESDIDFVEKTEAKEEAAVVLPENE